MAESEDIFDGHNDSLLRLLDINSPVEAFRDGNDQTHIDMPRLKETDFKAGMFAIFVPNENGEYERIETEHGYEYELSDPITIERAQRMTGQMLVLLNQLTTNIDSLVQIKTIRDLETLYQTDNIGAIPHLEGAEPVAPDLSNLDILYAAGIRSIGPVWSRPNAFGHGVKSRYPGGPDTGPGLTEAGQELINACADRGILIDCAHITEQGFWDVVDHTTNPIVVSHSGAYAISNHSRYLTDEQLDAIADSDGLVGITFASFGNDGSNDLPPIDRLVDHFEYIRDRIGVEHVAIGSDFDGASLPGDIEDVRGLNILIEQLHSRNFTQNEIDQITTHNWKRVLDEWW